MINKMKYPIFPVMIVDDEKHILTGFESELKGDGINHTIKVNDSRIAVQTAIDNKVGVVLLDLYMPHLNGMEVLVRLTEELPQVPVIIITGANDVEKAVSCMKTGAFDYLLKPVEEGVLTSCVKRAIRFADMNQEINGLKNRFFNRQLDNPKAFSDIVTDCEEMKAIFQYTELVAKTANPVLITGETGAGKELVANAVHLLSGRAGKRVTVNVAGLDDNVFSDTLFGHSKGAFTGADEVRRGMIEQASGGTLILDEIGDLSQASQVKLLRLLQQGEYLPLGEDHVRYSDARIIGVSNQDLEHKQHQGTFRNDLFYRLSAHRVHVPPLRKRMEDLPMLVDHFIEKSAGSLGVKPPAIPRELFDILGAYHFPGNIRELEAMVFNAVSVHTGGILSTKTIRASVGLTQTSTQPVSESDEVNPFAEWQTLPTLKQADTMIMEQALKRANNNISVAAKILGISRQALGKRLQRLTD